MNWGTVDGLGAVPIRVAVASVKRVILRIQAEVFLVRCHELVAPGEVARVTANDFAAQREGLLTGMEAGAGSGLHLRWQRVLLRKGWQAEIGAHHHFLLCGRLLVVRFEGQSCTHFCLRR